MAIWWMDDSPRLSNIAKNMLRTAERPRFSTASVWETAIKRASGKLAVPDSLWDVLLQQGFVSLDITVAHAEAAGALPLHHKDPFDRMLVAQAQLEGLSIMTADPAIGRYAVHVVPA